MKKLCVAVTVCALFHASDSAPAHACGFKAGGAIGAVRFDQLNHTSNPVNILMYSNPKSDDAKKSLSPTLERVLSKVGHAVMRTESKDEFLRIAQQGRFPCEEHGWHNVQVVIADLPDAELVDSQNGPIVLPMVSKPQEFDQAKRKKYPNVLTPSPRPSSHLPAVENAARLAHAKKSTGPILLAKDVREKAAGPEDRVLVASTDARTVQGAKNDRTPVATSKDGAEGDRGSAIGSGAGDVSKTDAPKGASAENEPKKADAAPVAVAAKTENASATMDAPPVAEQPKQETKAERLAREKAEKQAKLEEERQAKKEKAERDKQEKAEKAEAAKREKEERSAAAKRDKEERAAAAKQEREERAQKAKEAREAAMASRAAQPAPSEEKHGVGKKDEVYFARARYRVDAAAQEKLAPFLKMMKENTSAKFTLECHADRSGRPDLNMHLSQERAQQVKKYLVQKGIAESRLEVVAKGDEAPVDPPGDSWRNRCVVVKTASE